MPNRIIKESICSSEKLNQLSDFEFRLWVGLITYVDDAGRGDARPAIIKGRIFPLRERITGKEIESALNHMAVLGCIALYEVDGKPYLWFPTWKVHQRVRDCRPKYPEPPERGELPQVAADCGSRARESNPIQSESESESNPRGAGKPRFELPDWVPEQQWASFCEMRRKARHPLTDHAKKLILAELDRLRGDGHDPGAVLDQSTANAWRGVFPLKDAPASASDEWAKAAKEVWGDAA